MNRRQLLANGAIICLSLPSLQITDSTLSSARCELFSTPVVWDLEPESMLPESYEAPMSQEERTKILKQCATDKHIACYPIQEGDVLKVNRSFQSYSLFLISNPGWLGADSTDKISSLYKAYEAFARAIGSDHAAVFFWKKTPKKVDGKLAGTDLAANIDASRCMQYEKAFKLDISQSPHVVVTKGRPSPAGPITDFIILQLNGLSPASTEKFLTKLAEQLVGDKLDQEELGSERWWLTWRDVVVNTYYAISELAGHSKVTIKGGPVVLEIDGKK